MLLALECKYGSALIITAKNLKSSVLFTKRLCNISEILFKIDCVMFCVSLMEYSGNH